MSKELFEELNLTIAELRKENKELKKQLENYKRLGFKHLQDKNIELKEKYLNAIADYETTMSEKNELKKQLEEKEKLIEQCDLSVSNMMDCYCERTDCSGRIKDSKVYDSLVQKVETQQKEFIKYLQDEIYTIEPKGTSINYNCEYDSEEDCVMAMQEQSRLNTLKEILQKYKEIVGGINDKK